MEDGEFAIARESVVGWLQHQEGLVRSVKCEFRSSHSPTHPDMVPLIREICRRRGDEQDYLSYVYTVGQARERVTYWWRKGKKERADVYMPDDPKGVVSMKAFDGQLVRSLTRDGDRFVGSFHTVESADWNSMNRTHPFSFLYEFYNEPYSRIVAAAKSFDARSIVIDGKRHTRVKLLHPRLSERSLILVFDEQHRLVERTIIAKLGRDVEPRVYETHSFMDYRPHADASGETIWFPWHARYRYYMGVLDGTPVEYTSETIRITDLSFNVDIADGQFVFDFPSSTLVYDGVTGLGYVDAAELEEVPTAARRREQRLGTTVWYGVAVVLAIFTLAMVATVARRKARRQTD